MLPSDPNPKMDQLLKKYAQHRRAQAGPPLTMDPATRHLLQSEAARQRRQASAGRQPFLAIPILWRRLLLGGLGLAALLVLAGLWLHFDHERELRLANAQQSNLLFFAQSSPESVVQNPSPESAALP